MAVANCGASGERALEATARWGHAPATDTRPPMDWEAGGGVVLGRGRVISRLSPAASVFESVCFSFSAAEASHGEHQVNMTFNFFSRRRAGKTGEVTPEPSLGLIFWVPLRQTSGYPEPEVAILCT